MQLLEIILISSLLKNARITYFFLRVLHRVFAATRTHSCLPARIGLGTAIFPSLEIVGCWLCVLPSAIRVHIGTIPEHLPSHVYLLPSTATRIHVRYVLDVKWKGCGRSKWKYLFSNFVVVAGVFRVTFN